MSRRRRNEKQDPVQQGYSAKFHPHFRQDMVWWARNDKQVADRIWTLLEDILSDNPFTGIAKPEPLKYNTPNTWSRRITQEHRLVYRVEGMTVYFLQARYHY